MKKAMIYLLALACLTAAAGYAESDNYGNWYEVFIYSYQDSNADGIGDLNGLRSRLDYIADMGYTGLWLMPVMPSPSYHKYDVTDYMQIDPQYGTLEDFRALVEECHDRGIRIIIDLPVNHTSVQHPWFIAACEALRRGDAENPYIDYYCFSQKPGMKNIPVADTDWYYEEQFSGGGMPDLNLDSPAVVGEIRKIMDFWMNGCGVDGFRLDAVTSYYAADTQRNVAFLRTLKQTAEEIKPGSYLVGEAWTGLNEIAAYYESGVDSFFLFPVSQAEGYIVQTLRSAAPAAAFEKYLKQIDEAIPEGILAPFLSNHDTGRTVPALQARSNPAKAKFAEGLLNMLPGNAFTYYGEEIGMIGAGDDPNKRIAMYWNDEDLTAPPPGATKLKYAYPCADDQLTDPSSLLNYCRSVNHLRLSVPAIARGRNASVTSDGSVCIIERVWKDQSCRIVINFSETEAQEVRLSSSDLVLAGSLETGEDRVGCAQEESGIVLTLPPWSIAVLRKN